MFKTFAIGIESNPYEQLATSIEYEEVTKDRKGAVLIDYKDELIPLVRTTTDYKKPTQRFSKIHYDIIENIKKTSKVDDVKLNNALIEIYGSKYCTMGYHSDQSLDLDEKSYICIFSCYDNPGTKDVRKLIIKEKVTETVSDPVSENISKKDTDKCSKKSQVKSKEQEKEKVLEILLTHCSVVMFSVETNSKFLHKIVLEHPSTNDKWLGVTFRLSKTFVRFINEIPYFHPTTKVLRLASAETEKQQFYRLRSGENKSIKYVYPELDYTISSSDTMPIR